MNINIRKSLNTFVVEGLQNIFFFRRKFKATFYYTPIKKKVLDFESDDIDIKKLGNFKIGMDISEIEEWSEKNGYQSYHIKRF
jgi:hypothetical protein